MLMSRFRPKFIMWPTDQKDKMILWAQVNFDERAHVRRLGLLTGINLEVTISGRKLKSPELSIITKGIFVQKTHPQVIMFFEAAKNTSTRNLLNLIIEVSSSWIWSMIVSKAGVGSDKWKSDNLSDFVAFLSHFLGATKSDSKNFKKRQLVAFLSLICRFFCPFLKFLMVFGSKIFSFW